MSNARERAATRAGYRPELPGEPLQRPPTGRERAIERDSQLELESWLVMSWTVRAMRWAALIFALVQWWEHGTPGLVAGLAAWWFIGKLQPAPTENLDRYTKR